MDLHCYNLQGLRTVEFPNTGTQLSNDREAIEVISEAAPHKPDLIVIPAERLSPAFFDLKTRIAGEFLQKFVTYRKQVVISGDISTHLNKSSALRDFVYECNAGRQIWFVTSAGELDQKLMAILQYPIGPSPRDIVRGSQNRDEWLRVIADTPAEVRRVVFGLTDEQLDTPYRPGGWTVRQVVHHYADDHMNSYVRFKLALTEEAPVIKTCGEALWAELPDARLGPVEPSLTLLAALHLRWMDAWRAMTESDWLRTFSHPKRGPVSLEQLAALYAWHGKHHVAQVRALRERNGWTETPTPS